MNLQRINELKAKTEAHIGAGKESATLFTVELEELLALAAWAVTEKQRAKDRLKKHRDKKKPVVIPSSNPTDLTVPQFRKGDRM
jgi:hypothetical protein